jgi:DNA-binding winged helix-turn-helix (wHTH) protein/tetratricopeptide (TPR) repeat protein
MLGLEETIAIGPFRVDLAASRVFRAGVELELRPRAFRALTVLIQNPGRLVEYEQLIREAWDGTHVSKHTVNVTVGEIKDVLEEYGAWIICRPKFGYSLDIPKSDDLIRRGWHFWNQYTRLGFESALHCFQEAAQNDSADFRAFEGISSTYLMLAGFEMCAPRDIHKAFFEANRRAEALSGRLTPELRLDRAFGLCLFEKRMAESEAEALEVLRQRPKLVYAYIRLALIYISNSRLDEARDMMLRALATDALVPELAFLQIVIALFRREFDLAVECGKNTVDLHPGLQVGRAFYAQALEFAGYTQEAMVQYRLASSMAPDTPWILIQEARCLAWNGRPQEAQTILERSQRTRQNAYVDAYQLALLLEALGRRDEAFQELERAYEENSYALLFLDVDAKSDSLRDDPRFMGLRNRAYAGPVGD